MNILSLLGQRELAPALSETEAAALAAELGGIGGFEVYPRSIAAAHNALFFLSRGGDDKRLGVLSQGDNPALATFAGEARDVTVDGEALVLHVCPTDHANAVALRVALPYTAPQVLGLRKSVGCGDRLGLATPGHIRAIRKSRMAPILAQQSMRENARTGRTPQQVMDDAMWGIFQEGWRNGFGADADHLKTTRDIDLCVAAGYTFFTVDPGEYVDDDAHAASPAQLRAKVDALPWRVLESDPADLRRRLSETPIDLGTFRLTLSADELLRAAAKYGRAVAHTVSMYHHLQGAMGDRPFELEMSVDETDTPTSLAEHLYIAAELKRLGVRCVSLAPRYVGRFEKGVDYIGDLDEFEASFARHVAVARTFGPYKLSLHSGSDKFSIYPIAAQLAGDLIHLKTAGTSYLEALRAIALLNPSLFRRIVAFARQQYTADRRTYHVSARADRMPDANALPDDRLASILDNFHGRQILHVTFGSVLHHPNFREAFFDTLRGDEETYYCLLESHFDQHFSPFEKGD